MIFAWPLPRPSEEAFAVLQDNLGLAILRLQELMLLDPELAGDVELTATHLLAREINRENR